MKTQKFNTLMTAVQLVFFTLLITSSCAEANNNKQTSNRALSSKSVVAPNLDIHTAVLTGNLKVVQEHIAAGTDLNRKEPMSGSTPLMSAATFNKPEIARALIEAQVNLSIKNNDGGTALHTAVFFGRVEIVEMLIAANADKNIRNNFGATPREIALADFNQMKPVYEMLTQQLQPLGFTLDLNALQKALPIVAGLLQ